MSQTICCSLIRDNVTIAQHMDVFTQRVSPMEASLYSAPPYFVYNAQVQNAPVEIRQNDYLQDEVAIDSTSKTNVIYHVVNEPEWHQWNNRTEMKIEKTRLPT